LIYDDQINSLQNEISDLRRRRNEYETLATEAAARASASIEIDEIARALNKIEASKLARQNISRRIAMIESQIAELRRKQDHAVGELERLKLERAREEQALQSLSHYAGGAPAVHINRINETIAEIDQEIARAEAAIAGGSDDLADADVAAFSSGSGGRWLLSGVMG
jgi:chromosome segregation ATPase